MSKALFISLLTITFAYTGRDLDLARACLRLTTFLPPSVEAKVAAYAGSKSELSYKKLYDKIMIDLFENCRRKITDEEQEYIKYSGGNYDSEDFMHLYVIRPELYNTPQDLETPVEHYKLRDLLIKTEKTEQVIMPSQELREKIKSSYRPGEL